jgi:uncharacterized membrane protein
VSVVQVSVVVDAPPEKVWDVVSDPRNLPRWDRHISAVDGVPRSGLHEGSEYQTEIRFLGARAHATSRVIEIRPPDYAKVRVRGLLNATVETWVEPIDDGRSRLRHRVDYRFPGGPLGELAARAVKLLGASAIMDKGIQAQKRQAEAG